MDNSGRRGFERVLRKMKRPQTGIGKLVLTRKKDESIIINGNIRITVERLERHKVSLSFQAPKGVIIAREELLHDAESEEVATEDQE